MTEIPYHPEMIAVGSRLYSRCGTCDKVVRATGWFAGMHRCLSPDEWAAKQHHALWQQRA